MRIRKTYANMPSLREAAHEITAAARLDPKLTPKKILRPELQAAHPSPRLKTARLSREPHLSLMLGTLSAECSLKPEPLSTRPKARRMYLWAGAPALRPARSQSLSLHPHSWRTWRLRASEQ